MKSQVDSAWLAGETGAFSRSRLGMLWAVPERIGRYEEFIPFECLLAQEEPVLVSESREGENDNTDNL